MRSIAENTKQDNFKRNMKKKQTKFQKSIAGRFVPNQPLIGHDDPVGIDRRNGRKTVPVADAARPSRAGGHVEATR